MYKFLLQSHSKSDYFRPFKLPKHPRHLPMHLPSFQALSRHSESDFLTSEWSKTDSFFFDLDFSSQISSLLNVQNCLFVRFFTSKTQKKDRLTLQVHPKAILNPNFMLFGSKTDSFLPDLVNFMKVNKFQNYWPQRPSNMGRTLKEG